MSNELNLIFLMRTFFALDLPAQSKLNLDTWRTKALPPAKGDIPMTNFHITLCFNGETSESQLDKLQKLVDELAFYEFEIQLDNFGYFQKPGIAFVGCSAIPNTLLQLNEKLTAISQRLSLGVAHQTFTPHVSVFRKMPMPPPAPLFAPDITFKANKFGLYESIKHKHGVVYRAIFEWELERRIHPGKRGRD
ncbi:RNA 2',3'-cyclic phosphodiesterase [Alteromonas sp. a30]|uniref:RNA 2',3'-cyclic phosphodiesterase n=1 Tax=Alteromonas sp. a30 TaxID=2730917 RepID=UPI00227F6A16|nr:RNA 2',3'-cyclic phosphodiesterase [Alteromonas sp. a30]MCY7294629.1 RNA 2',3'-cyclic phosphodiesterase [Alteromonas sp. a30]